MNPIRTAWAGAALPALTEPPPPAVSPEVADDRTNETPGTIIVDPHARHLYPARPGNKTMRHAVAMGAAGYGFTREAHQVESGKGTVPPGQPLPQPAMAATDQTGGTT